MTTPLIDPKVEEFLEHHGVKGMHWGVRRDRGESSGSSGSSSGLSKKVVKKDTRFEKKANTRDTMLAVHNGAARDMNVKLRGINLSPAYKGKNLNKDPKLAAKYEAEVAREWSKSLQKSAASLGTNASGTRRYTVEEHDDNTWSVTTTEIKHAAEDVQLYKVTKNDQGLITSIAPVVTEAEHDALAVEDFLEHFGVKGMHWGVRRERSGGGSSSPHPVSTDHTRASELKNTAKKHGTKALSNEEFEVLLKRMDLEKRYSSITSQEKSQGQKIVTEILVNAGKQQASQLLAKGGKSLTDAITKKVLEGGKK